MKKRTKRIVFLSTFLTAGGAERNMLNIISYFTRRQIRSEIILFKDRNQYADEYRSLLKNTDITPLMPDKKIPRLFMPVAYVFFFFRLISLMRTRRYAAIVAVEEFTLFPTVLLSLVLRIPSIAIIGDNLTASRIQKHRSVIGRVIHSWYRFLLCRATRIVCVSKGLQRQLLHEFRVPEQKLSLIFNGVDIPYVQKKCTSPLPDTAKQLLQGYPLCIMHGRLAEKKGHGAVIEAFKTVVDSYPHAKLLIMGTGPEENELKTRAARFKLKNNIVFTGLVPMNPYAYLKRGDMFLFNSYHEGFGNVIVEAMACGLPIIASDCRFGPRDLLAYEKDYDVPIQKPAEALYGVLVPPPRGDSRHTKILAATIIDLAENKTKRSLYRRRSLARCRDFTATQMARGYYDIVKEFI